MAIDYVAMITKRPTTSAVTWFPVAARLTLYQSYVKQYLPFFDVCVTVI